MKIIEVRPSEKFKGAWIALEASAERRCEQIEQSEGT
jgi:hypothetical protein